MVLTQLEVDLLAHLAPSGRPVRELRRFVELHADRDDAASASEAFERLVERWAARGWLASGRPAASSDALVADWRVLQPGALLLGEAGETRLWLTKAARRDVAWLPLPPSGALQQWRSPSPGE